MSAYIEAQLIMSILGLLSFIPVSIRIENKECVPILNNWLAEHDIHVSIYEELTLVRTDFGYTAKQQTLCMFENTNNCN